MNWLRYYYARGTKQTGNKSATISGYSYNHSGVTDTTPPTVPGPFNSYKYSWFCFCFKLGLLQMMQSGVITYEVF
jgi:hypothetical protein